VNQKPLSASEFVIVAKQADLIPNAAVALVTNPQAYIDDRWEGYLLEVFAVGLRYQTDDRTGFNIEDTVLHQVLAHGGIEEGQIGDVRHMAVSIVVSPPRCHHAEMHEGGSGLWSRSIAHSKTP
jgi:hypothetical protein